MIADIGIQPALTRLEMPWIIPPDFYRECCSQVGYDDRDLLGPSSLVRVTCRGFGAEVNFDRAGCAAAGRGMRGARPDRGSRYRGTGRTASGSEGVDQGGIVVERSLDQRSIGMIADDGDATGTCIQLQLDLIEIFNPSILEPWLAYGA